MPVRRDRVPAIRSVALPYSVARPNEFIDSTEKRPIFCSRNIPMSHGILSVFDHRQMWWCASFGSIIITHINDVMLIGPRSQLRGHKRTAGTPTSPINTNGSRVRDPSQSGVGSPLTGRARVLARRGTMLARTQFNRFHSTRADPPIVSAALDEALTYVIQLPNFGLL
jgi:hypothetical protein